jgi:hypothetical protein
VSEIFGIGIHRPMMNHRPSSLQAALGVVLPARAYYCNVQISPVGREK